jgi:hypothetical protein
VKTDPHALADAIEKTNLKIELVGFECGAPRKLDTVRSYKKYGKVFLEKEKNTCPKGSITAPVSKQG